MYFCLLSVRPYSFNTTYYHFDIDILTFRTWMLHILHFRSFKNNSSFLKTYDLATSLTSISSSHRHHLCRTFKNICSNYSKTLTLDSSLIIWKTWSTNKNLSNVPFKALLHLFKYPLSSLIFLANILKRMRYFRVF